METHVSRILRLVSAWCDGAEDGLREVRKQRPSVPSCFDHFSHARLQFRDLRSELPVLHAHHQNVGGCQGVSLPGIAPSPRQLKQCPKVPLPMPAQPSHGTAVSSCPSLAKHCVVLSLRTTSVVRFECLRAWRYALSGVVNSTVLSEPTVRTR